MKKYKKLIAGGIALLVVVGIIIAAVLIDSKPEPVGNLPGPTCPRYMVDGVDTITYDGVSGETALATLQSLCEVTLHPSYDGFVTAIAGAEADDAYFWAFYVNGEMAVVGAGEYQQREGDEVKWVLTAIDTNF